jgi:chromosome condensin MukBEF MukE localization factor
MEAAPFVMGMKITSSLANAPFPAIDSTPSFVVVVALWRKPISS